MSDPEDIKAHIQRVQQFLEETEAMLDIHRQNVRELQQRKKPKTKTDDNNVDSN